MEMVIRTYHDGAQTDLNIAWIILFLNDPLPAWTGGPPCAMLVMLWQACY